MLKRKALLIGTFDFKEDPMSLLPLQGPRHDLIALKGALCHPAKGLFYEDDVVPLENPTLGEAKARIHDFFNDADKDDALVFYFSGHGRVSINNEFYLCLADTQTGRLSLTALEAGWLRGRMEASAARTIVVLLDCCHSGAFKGQALPADVLVGQGIFVMSSSRARQLTQDGEDGSSPFTAAIVDALMDSTGDIDNDGYITFDDVYRIVYGRLRESGQFPQRSTAEGTVNLARSRPKITSLSSGASQEQAPCGPRNTTTAVMPWPQRFDAVVRLSIEAHDKLASDPWGAATRAQHAIEHIVDYLYERELGPAEPTDKLDAKLRRVRAKLVIPPITAGHFDFVQIYTSSVIDAGETAIDPDHLRPCFDSLTIVVDWFFRDYLKDSRPRLGRDANIVFSDTVPDATPHSTIGTVVNTGSRIGTASNENIGIWRALPVASTLRLDASEGDEPGQCMFKIEQPGRTYFIGRTQQRSDHTRNDFGVPKVWNSISRDQGTIAIIQDVGVLLTNTSDKNNVFVRGELVPAGSSRVLRHGDPVQLGRCIGAFSDGRYYPTAPANWIDRRTGLLSRAGLIAEISGSLKKQEQRVLFVVRCSEDADPGAGAPLRDLERVAVMVAIAIHRYDPAIQVGRIGMDVAALLNAKDAVNAVADAAAKVAGAACVSGFIVLAGAAEEAMARLEACMSALSRIAITGRALAGPEDLTRYALTRTPLDAFATQVRPLYADGGGAILFTLGELERLDQLPPQVVPVLELELVEMLGGRMGPRELVAFAGRGLLLFGMAGDVETFAQEIGAAWHARGPVTTSAIEIDRSLSAHLLALSDFDHLEERIAGLARGDAVLGASGLPAPLALAARVLNEAHDPIKRARELVRFAELTWKFLAFVLLASARSVGLQRTVEDGPREVSWPTPWRSLARDAARRLEGQAPRVHDLASVATSSFDSDGRLCAVMDLISGVAPRVMESTDLVEIGRILPRLERAVRELLAALGPLRGWTLIGIVNSEFVDVSGTSQCIEYVDYTGPSARGAHQRVTLSDYPGLGRFAYLVRWNEGIAIALEPYARCVNNEDSRDNELFLASEPILEPGLHRYRSVATGYEIELLVTSKQLGSRR